MKPTIKVKRIYEPAENSDGIRVLVDRVWPRGVNKEQAQLTVWMKEVAPSTELRKWFGHLPERFVEFTNRYKTELSSDLAQKHIEQLLSWAKEDVVTLLYSAKDKQYNQAEVLKNYLERQSK